MTTSLDQRAAARYRDAAASVSARTVAELHRRRIAACTEPTHARTHKSAWALAAGFAAAFALVLGLTWRLPQMSAPEIPTVTAVAALDAANALEALEAINLTALDEDSEFFLWLATHEASLLAME